MTKRAASHSDGLIFQADSIQSERLILDLKYFSHLVRSSGAINVRVKASSQAVQGTWVHSLRSALHRLDRCLLRAYLPDVTIPWQHSFYHLEPQLVNSTWP